MSTKSRKHIWWYTLVLCAVLALAVYVQKTRKTFKQEQYIATLIQQYAHERQQKWQWDNISQPLTLPSNASPEMRCIASILHGAQDCPEDIYKESRYDKGAVSLLQGMTLWSVAEGTWELLSGYYALRTATESLGISHAQRLAGRISWVVSASERVAQAGRYGIAVDFLVTYGDLLQQYAKELIMTLDQVLVHINAIQTRLGMLNPTTSDAKVCIETLQKAMASSHRTTSDLKVFVERIVESRVKQYIATCLHAPDRCVVEQEEQLWSVESGLVSMQQGTNQYLIIYSDLINGLIQAPQKTLQELCSWKSKIDNTQARRQIEQGVGSLSPQAQQWAPGSGESQWWEVQSGGVRADETWLPRGIQQIQLNDYQQNYLKQMYERQNEYLQQRKSLQQDPSFSPKDLLRQLFEEFYGNEDEFE